MAEPSAWRRAESGFEVLPAAETATASAAGYELIRASSPAATPASTAAAPASTAAAPASQQRRRRPQRRRGPAAAVLPHPTCNSIVIAAVAIGSILSMAGIFFGLSYLSGGTRFVPLASTPARGRRPRIRRRLRSRCRRRSPRCGEGTPPVAAGTIEIGIAYGTEKQTWLEWAAKEFADTRRGPADPRQLDSHGLDRRGPRDPRRRQAIHVWSPASKLYRQTSSATGSPVQGRPDPRGGNAGADADGHRDVEEAATRTSRPARRSPSRPSPRHERAAPVGAPSPASREWGHFKFGHTHPDQSNSGLVTLILMAYEFQHKTAGLSGGDMGSPDFQDFLVNSSAASPACRIPPANMMKEMVLKGPSGFDALMVYESVAIDLPAKRRGTLGPLPGRLSEVQPLERQPVLHPQHALDHAGPSAGGRPFSSSS